MTIYANAYPNTSGLIIDNQLAVRSIEDSSSTDSGSVQLLGGIGIAGNVWAGNVWTTTVTANSISITGNIQASGIFSTGNVQASGIFSTGNLTVLGTLRANIISTTGSFQYLTVSNSTYSSTSVMNKGYIDGIALIFGV